MNDHASSTRGGMPPFLLAATLLFWGWQAGWLWLGALAAAALEGARFVRTRWTFAQADLDRIWNLTVLIFFGSAIVAFVNNDGASAITGLLKNQSLAVRGETLAKSARSVILFFEWMPLTLLPIALAQAYSTELRMDWSTFSWWLRRQRRAEHPWVRKGRGLQVLWPYFGACLLAASAANERTYRFTVGMAALVVWALWSCRPRRLPTLVWCGAVSLALGLGFLAQSALRQVQRIVQRLDAALVARLGGSGNFSDKEHRTMLGTLGALKGSGSIVLRVETEGPPPPALLREASYNLFRSPFWAVPRQEFVELTSETNVTTTVLMRGPALSNSVTISSFFPGGEGLLPLPLGAGRLDDLLADVETNHMGVVHIRDGPGFARFHVAYQAGQSIDSGPSGDDLDVPFAEKPTVVRVIESLGLANQSDEQKLRTIARYFAERFRYSTWLGPGPRSPTQTALTRFLLQTRTGHCEYFATATTLLLRQAGIPARYAVGHSVQEQKGREWIVRERHSHAWCLAWVDGAWRDIDNTPADWAQVESARAGWWESVSDGWSTIWFAFSKWRWGTSDWRRYIVLLLLPLLVLTAWRLLSQKQWSRRQISHAGSTLPLARLGLDSEFYLIERHLHDRGLERRPGETLQAWLARLDDETDVSSLRPLLALHYRLRFDPAGIREEERRTLKRSVEAWVQTPAKP